MRLPHKNADLVNIEHLGDLKARYQNMLLALASRVRPDNFLHLMFLAKLALAGADV